MKNIYTITLIIFFLSIQAQPLQTNFEDYPLGEFTQQSWLDGGFDVPWVNGFDQGRAEIDNSTANSGTQSLRIFYPEGEYGTANTGAQAPINLPPAQTYFLTYAVKFSENFSWGGSSEGGKLPGLAGGDRCSGCSNCTGSNGFSARLMWRTDGRATLYLYHMDKSGNCGDTDNFIDDGQTIYFNKNTWYTITQKVKVNSGSNKDGEVKMWVNNKEVLHLTGLQFVDNGDLVDNMYFSTFHGGGNSNWSAQVDSYTWFDDIVISTDSLDVFQSQCKAPDLGEDLSLCGTQGNGLDINAGINASNRTFSWTKDGISFAGNVSSINVTQPGIYRVLSDSAGCISADEVEVSDVITPNLGENYELCNSSIYNLDAGIGGNGFEYTWFRNDEELSETDKILAVRASGEYIVSVKTQDCNAAFDTVLISSELLPFEDDILCGPGIATLKVFGDAIYNWFDAEEEGALIHQGNEYSTFVSETSTFFVEDASGFQTSVGKLEPDFTNNRTWGNDSYDRKLKFSVFQSGLSLDSVTVYPEIQQDVVINLYASDNSTILEQKTFNNLGTGAQRLFLGFEIPVGDYFIGCAGSTGRLIISNDNDLNINYPYEIQDVISIGAYPQWVQDSPWYLFLYDWSISSGNFCARSAVKAIVDEEDESCLVNSETLDELNSEIRVFPNPSNAIFWVELSDELLGANLKIFDSRGSLLVEKNLINTITEFNTARLGNGLYYLTIEQGSLRAAQKILITQ